MKMSRVWAMPNHDTFSIKPIGEFVRRYLSVATVSVDPFARNKDWFTHTNDLNPATTAQHHMDALDFLGLMAAQGVKADLVIFDPPYSPRQITECYASVGRKATMQDTQSSFYSKLRDAINPLLQPGGVCLSFGWNSVGMGKGRGFVLEEVLLTCHGGAHCDTICIAERKL